jgi:hypothetical protein
MKVIILLSLAAVAVGTNKLDDKTVSVGQGIMCEEL